MKNRYNMTWTKKDGEKVTNQYYTADQITHQLENLEEWGATAIEIKQETTEETLKHGANYYLTLVKETGEDWAILENTNRNYLLDIMDGLAVPPEYEKIELRVTYEPLDTHLHYEVIAERKA